VVAGFIKMVNWMDPNLILTQDFVYKQLVVFLTGLFGWEFVLTFWLDWGLMTRRIRFKITYIFWFIGRYSLLSAMICLIIVTRSHEKLNCTAIIPFMSAGGLIAVACSSTNLMLRTLAIWKYTPYVTWPLCFMCLVHFLYLIYAGSTSLRSYWDDDMGTCMIVTKTQDLLAATFIYTLSFDFIIFVVTIIGVYRIPSRSPLWYMLYNQGLLYFTFTCLCNIPAATFTLLDLNPAMNVMFSPIASTMSTVLACRAVVSLMSMEPERQSSRPKVVALHSSTRKPYSTHNPSGQLTSHLGFPSSVYAPDLC